MCCAVREVYRSQRRPGWRWGKRLRCHTITERKEDLTMVLGKVQPPVWSSSCYLWRGCEATCGVTGGELAGRASAVDMLGEAPAIGGQVAAGAGIGGRLAWPSQLQVLGAHFPLFNLEVSFCPRKKIYLKGWAVGAAIPISPGQCVPFLVG